MIGVRWILAAGALSAGLWCGGCSKGPGSASADEGKRTPREQARPVEPAAPPPPAYPSVGDDAAGGDFTAALGKLAPAYGGDAERVDGPWAGARCGQFVTYRGAGGIRLTHKVVAVDAETVTVETSTSLGEARRNRHPLRVRAGEAVGGVPATAQWESRELVIDGKRLPCRAATWVARYGSRQSIRRVWLCDQVPGRLVRSERDDGNGGVTVVLELVEFGG